MEYFILRHTVDTEETGPAYPQAIFNNPKKLNPNPVLIANMSNGKYLPKEILPFDYFELNKKARLTDLMSSHFGGNGFLISEKLRNIFEKSNIKDCQYYDVKLFNDDKEIKGYSYFHSASSLREYVNYKKSFFYICDILKKFIRDMDVTLNNFQELEDYKKNLPYGQEAVCAKQFYLNNNFPFNLDLFGLNAAFNYDIFINNRLAEKLEHNNITGISILSAKDLIKTPILT